MTPPPSGEQFELTYGAERATIVEVGAGIRAYAVDGRDVLDPYPRDRMADGAHSQTLIPWPNRLADGRYRFAGNEHQVALTEPEKHNAIHGLLRWRPWTADEPGPDRIVMRTRLLPQMGYPFALELSVAYALGEDGLVVTTTARNAGEEPCPYGCGHHPYLSPGRGPIDDCTLQAGARTRIVTDEERKLPLGRQAVEGTAYDFRAARLIGGEHIDDSFTDLDRDADGRARVRLRAPDGTAAELWLDERYPYLELYTGDTLSPERARQGLGTEPMSCAPNAFQSEDGLVRLEPGETFAATWGARLV